MKVLVIEDCEELITTIREKLRNYYTVDTAKTGLEGEELFDSNDYDVVILDLTLPDMDGTELCRRICRQGDNVPVIILSGRSDFKHKVNALNVGADDYLEKPFHFEELLARIRAVLRRRSRVTEIDSKLTADGLILDLETKIVSYKGNSVKLRQKEFLLLEFLLRNKGVVLNRSRILEHVWDSKTNLFTNTVDVHIQSLRRKIDKKFKTKFIRTVHGFGYQLKI